MSQGAVVTEYAWDANSCDPCPTPALEPDSIATLGADALAQPAFATPPAPQALIEAEVSIGEAPQQRHGANASSTNNFQARDAIRHPWTGPIKCDNPQRGVWGGPPEGVQGDTSAKPALKVAFAPRGNLNLASFLAEGVPELQIAASPAAPLAVADPGARGCGSCGAEGSGRAVLPGGIAALLALLARARRRARGR